MEVFKITKYKAMLRIKEEPFKIIKWFTNNFDKEVGALGIGELKDGEMVIEKLVFPKQVVNGAHVHFKPEDWAPVLQELTPEEIGKIIFYWHKHPGSAAASQGDEDDTFDVFMPEENCERPFFGFMQTAKKTNGDMDYEARIELRDPIWATIEDVELVTDQDDGIQETCEQIIKDKIVAGSLSANNQPGVGKPLAPVDTGKRGCLADAPITKSMASASTYDVTFETSMKNGNILLEVSDYFAPWIVDVLNVDLKTCVKKAVKRIKDGSVLFTIIPLKKKGREILDHFEALADDIFYVDTAKTLESTLHADDVYIEEKDIQNFNTIADNKQSNWYGGWTK